MINIERTILIMNHDRPQEKVWKKWNEVTKLPRFSMQNMVAYVSMRSAENVNACMHACALAENGSDHYRCMPFLGLHKSVHKHTHTHCSSTLCFFPLICVVSLYLVNSLICVTHTQSQTHRDALFYIVNSIGMRKICVQFRSALWACVSNDNMEWTTYSFQFLTK